MWGQVVLTNDLDCVILVAERESVMSEMTVVGRVAKGMGLDFVHINERNKGSSVTRYHLYRGDKILLDTIVLEDVKKYLEKI